MMYWLCAASFLWLSSGIAFAFENEQFSSKTIEAVITDNPYYDAITYADLSDFFMYG